MDSLPRQCLYTPVVIICRWVGKKIEFKTSVNLYDGKLIFAANWVNVSIITRRKSEEKKRRIARRIS